MSAAATSLESEYLTAIQVRARFGGVSDMWLFRKIRDQGFPAPIHFGSPIRYFRLADVVLWERAAATRDYTLPKPPRRGAQS